MDGLPPRKPAVEGIHIEGAGLKEEPEGGVARQLARLSHALYHVPVRKGPLCQCPGNCLDLVQY